MPILRSLLTVVLLVTPALGTDRRTEAVLLPGFRMASTPGVPTWNRDAERRAAHPAMQP